MTGPTEADYRSVARERRRRVLAYLREAETTTKSLTAVVDAVIERKTNSPTPDRESVRLDLYHVHLPLLDDAGVVDFDNTSETVRYRGDSKIEALLDGSTRAGAGTDTERV